MKLVDCVDKYLNDIMMQLQEKEYTVTPNDTYRSFIQNIERQNDGYHVSSIKTKLKGVKIYENNFMSFRDADVDHSVVVLLKKK